MLLFLLLFEFSIGNATDYKAKYVRPSKLNIPQGATFVIEESYIPHTTSVSVESTSLSAPMEI